MNRFSILDFSSFGKVPAVADDTLVGAVLVLPFRIGYGWVGTSVANAWVSVSSRLHSEAPCAGSVHTVTVRGVQVYISVLQRGGGGYLKEQSFLLAELCCRNRKNRPKRSEAERLRGSMHFKFSFSFRTQLANGSIPSTVYRKTFFMSAFSCKRYRGRVRRKKKK